MFTKLAIFGVGYLLGSKAGRARYEAIVAGGKDLLTGEELAAAVGFLRGAWWIISQRGQGLDRREP